MPTVLVKIAVAVDPSGKWSAYGYSQEGSSFPDENAMDAAVDGLGEGDGEARYWVTAVLQVPEAVTIAGKVEHEEVRT